MLLARSLKNLRHFRPNNFKTRGDSEIQIQRLVVPSTLSSETEHWTNATGRMSP